MQAPTKVNLRTSILDCRRIYQDMTDCAFATWYSKRYKVLSATILEIIEEEREGCTQYRQKPYLTVD